jgi:hypothetical protein
MSGRLQRNAASNFMSVDPRLSGYFHFYDFCFAAVKRKAFCGDTHRGHRGRIMLVEAAAACGRSLAQCSQTLRPGGSESHLSQICGRLSHVANARSIAAYLSEFYPR